MFLWKEFSIAKNALSLIPSSLTTQWLNTFIILQPDSQRIKSVFGYVTSHCR